MTEKPDYIYRGVNGEQVPVGRVAGAPERAGMLLVEVLEPVGGYRTGEWLSAAWHRLEKVERKA